MFLHGLALPDGKVRIVKTVAVHQGIVAKTIEVVEGEAGLTDEPASQKILRPRIETKTKAYGKFFFSISIEYLNSIQWNLARNLKYSKTRYSICQQSNGGRANN